MIPPACGEELAARDRPQGELDARADALQALAGSRVPFLVAGAYAFFEYTGIFRDTKDLDLFLRERDLEEALRVLEDAGFRTVIEDATWIAKGFRASGSWTSSSPRGTASRPWTTCGSSTRGRGG